jgi:serine/threonine protein kinase
VLEGRYRVERIVGDGGHGVVLRAQHLSLGTPVALKVLRVATALAPPLRAQMLARLRDEGRVLHALSRSTPAVVQALDVFSVELPDGAWAPCLVMEWLEGVTLAEARERGHLRALLFGEPARAHDRLTPDEVVRALAPLAEALSHAHAAGIAHRDVKPSNVMLVGRQPLLKLLDFGIAKVMRTPAEDTRAFEASGTTLVAFSPAYAAPEQIEPGYGATGPWTDVFALALVVVELLTDQRALGDANAAECARRALDPETRPTPRALGVPVSDAVEAALRRALAVDPRNRPRTADAFWTELAAACRAPVSTETVREPAGTRTETRSVRASRPRDGGGIRPLLYALIAFGIGVLTLLGLVLANALQGPQPPVVSPATIVAASSAARAEIEAPSPPPSSKAVKGRCPGDSKPIRDASFCLGRLEVTVKELGPKVPRRSSSKDPRCTVSGKTSDPPVNCVSSAQARAHCQALGGDLPTKTQWITAAERRYFGGEAKAVTRKRTESASSACVLDRTRDDVCGMVGGLSEFVLGPDGHQCLLGAAWDSGGFSPSAMSACRMSTWSDNDADVSAGFRCAFVLR